LTRDAAEPGWLRRYYLKSRNWRFVLPRRPALRAVPGANITGYFNATLLAADPQKLTLICRKAYYTLSDHGHMVGSSDHSLTQNFRVELLWTSDRYVPGETQRIDALDGLEDVRVFQTPGRTWFFAVELLSAAETARHPHRLHSRPVTGIIHGSNAALSIQRMAIPETFQTVEKNWVFYRDRNRLLIEKSPDLSDQYAVDTEALTLTRLGTPRGKRFWSGTKAIDWEGGTLFLDHRRVKLREMPGIKVRYVYRFRHQSGATVRHSRDFSMGPRGSVLYISDLQRAGELGPQFGDGIVLSLSTDDNSFSLLRIPASRLAKMLR
jgi:hypothetical protein